MIIMDETMGMTMRSMRSINYQRDSYCRISQTMPTTSCACPDDMKLSKDWRTCVAKNPAKKTSTTTAPVPQKKKPITTRGTTSRGMKSETTETPILHHGEADVKPVAQEDSRCSLKSYRLYFILVLKIRRQSFKKASRMKTFRFFLEYLIKNHPQPVSGGDPKHYLGTCRPCLTWRALCSSQVITQKVRCRPDL